MIGVGQRKWVYWYRYVTENRLAVRCFSRNNVIGIRSLGIPVTVTSRFTKFADNRIWRKILFVCFNWGETWVSCQSGQ
jgi:hypothetical protein